MEVGFIGLGHMGQAMARNLLRGGHRVIAYNRTRGKAEALAADGAEVADRPGQCCRGEAVITMLSDDAAVESVVFGDAGILATLAPGKAHVSMSTVSVQLSDRLTEAHGNAGQIYLAAPVFGRPEAAAAAKLFIVVAGEDGSITRYRALFDMMGQRLFTVADKPSSANLVKLCGNFLIASMLESLGETVALARKAGIDVTRYIDILTNSLFAAPVYRTYGAMIASEHYEPAGFRMLLGLKDIRLALAAAEAEAVPMPVASLVRDHFIEGVAQGDGDADWAALARVAARNAGL
jgi:3-hydroxyisobutyrate dehydrogenase-like beta-hydroxyacid dehydrogenase